MATQKVRRPSRFKRLPDLQTFCGSRPAFAPPDKLSFSPAPVQYMYSPGMHVYTPEMWQGGVVMVPTGPASTFVTRLHPYPTRVAAEGDPARSAPAPTPRASAKRPRQGKPAATHRKIRFTDEVWRVCGRACG